MVNIFLFFDVHLGSENEQDVTQMQGTVIYYITDAVRLGHNIAKEFHKLLKGSICDPSKVLTPFNIALALSLTTISTYKETVILHSYVQNLFNSTKKHQSYFVL